MNRIFIALFLLIAIVALTAQHHHHNDYEEWKHSLLPDSKSTMILGPVENDYVAVQVDDDELFGDPGLFNIGTSSIHPFRPDETLIFPYPGSPGTSHMVFKIDDEYYSPRLFTDATEILPDFPFAIHPWTGDSSYIEGGWIIGDILIMQKLQPVYLISTHGDTTGSIFIRYMIANQSATATHDVGVRLEFDTMVGSNDSAPLATSYGYAANEDEFTFPNIPDYYQAGENDYPWSPTDLVAAGYLTGYDAVSPDRFLVGAWGTYTGVLWDYTPTFGPYGDSAVLIYWYPRSVAPGETTYVATYYGLGLPERTPPDVSFMDPPEYYTLACDDQIIRVAVFDSSGVDTTTFTITVDGSTFVFPDHMTTEHPADTVYFVWQPDAGFFTEPLETVEVSVDYVADIWGTNILSPIVWHFIVDLQGPQIISYSIDTGAVVANLQHPVDIVITDNYIGVDTASAEVNITTRSGINQNMTIATGLVWLDDSTLHIDPAAAAISYGYIDSVHIEIIQCIDKSTTEYCDANDIHPNGFWFFTGEPPECSLMVPEEGCITSCTDQIILIQVEGEEAIVPDSIRIYVDGDLYTYIDDPSVVLFHSSTDIIEFNTGGMDVFDDGPVLVELLPLYTASGAESDSSSWIFYVDATPPSLYNPVPTPGSEIMELEFDVSFTLADTGIIMTAVSGLDTSSVETFVINGQGIVTNVTSYLTGSNPYTFNTGTANLEFIDGEEVTIRVTAADNPITEPEEMYCDPNDTTFEWTFTIAEMPCYRGTNPITPEPWDERNDYTQFSFPNVRATKLKKEIFIYDRFNHLVKTIDNPDDDSGEWIWNGKDDNNIIVGQGVYVYVIVVDGETVCTGTVSVAR